MDVHRKPNLIHARATFVLSAGFSYRGLESPATNSVLYFRDSQVYWLHRMATSTLNVKGGYKHAHSIAQRMKYPPTLITIGCTFHVSIDL
jgi:hypothetical protein